eukprot:m.336546 g.336546  ORF g.336546 m.336546 type:complete len:1473 (-) comp17889_c0_seq1:101-4519(-)
MRSLLVIAAVVCLCAGQKLVQAPCSTRDGPPCLKGENCLYYGGCCVADKVCGQSCCKENEICHSYGQCVDISTPLTTAVIVELPEKVYTSCDGAPLNFAVHSRGNNDVTVTAKTSQGQNISTTVSATNGRTSGSLELGTDVASGSLTVYVEGEAISETTTVSTVREQLATYMVKDKGIYKPGDLVQIRVFVFKSNFKAATCEDTSFSVELVDPRNTVIERLPELDGSAGIVDVEFQLTAQTQPGVWKVILNGNSEMKSVEMDLAVEKYTLPRFEAVLTQLPPTLTRAQSEEGTITGSINGLYSFGKQVVGSAEVSVKVSGSKEPICPPTTVMLDGLTPTLFTLSLNAEVCHFRHMNRRQAFIMPDFWYPPFINKNLIVSAVVKEENFMDTAETTHSITTVEQPYNARIVSDMSGIAPGIAFTGELTITDLEGGFVGLPSFEVTASTNNGQVDTFACTLVNGKCKFTVPLSLDEKSLSFQVSPSVNWKEGNSWYPKTSSPSDSYLRVTASASSPNTVTVDAKTTVPVSMLGYSVIVGDVNMLTSTHTFDSANSTSFDITIVKAMQGPNAKLYVYFLTSFGELVQDLVPFPVSHTLRHTISAQFGAPSVRPGSTTTLSVSAGASTAGMSAYGIVAVDRSVGFLAGNEVLTKDTVLGDVAGARGSSSMAVSGTIKLVQSEGVFSGGNTGRGIIIDDVFLGGPVFAFEVEDQAFEKDLDASGDESSSESTRKFFPETWIFQQGTVADGQTDTLQLTVPDSISTFDLRSVAMSSENGLAIGDPVSLQVFKPFFTQLKLPYSIVRGESFKLIATVFNYQDEASSDALNVTLTLSNADGMEYIADSTVHTCENLEGSAQCTYTFEITPLNLGIMTVVVRANSSDDDVDNLERTVIVKPEGEYAERISSAVMEAGEETAFMLLNTTVETDMLVPGSVNVVFMATSDMMGPSVDGIESLVRMPYGCGEQNMITLTPIIYVRKYKEDTNSASEQLRADTEKYMKAGIQRQYTYQHTMDTNTGGYSAFGDSDDKASLWLSAFVLGSFAEASEFVPNSVDASSLSQTVDFILNMQYDDGHFAPYGRVIHTDMKGNAHASNLTLTAYITLQLHIASKQLYSSHVDLTTGIANARSYLETMSTDPELTDYTMALMSYTLLSIDSTSSIGNALLARLMANINGDHFGGDAPPDEGPIGVMARSSVHGPNSNEVETTAYALLAVLVSGDDSYILAEGAMAKWLAEARNGNGGWSSTQDTIVALKALATHAAAYFDEQGSITVTVTSSDDFTHVVSIDENNFDILQTVVIPTSSIDTFINVSVSGQGQVLVVAKTSWYALPDLEVIDIIIQDGMTSSTGSDFSQKVCVRLSGDGDGTGMAVVDVGLPSGFSVDDALACTQNSAAKRCDVEGGHLIFYLDEITGEETCLEFAGYQVDEVVDLKAPIIAAYDYYHPELSGVKQASLSAQLGGCVCPVRRGHRKLFYEPGEV